MDFLESTLATLRQAVALAPSNGFLWLQIAEVLKQLGRHGEAEDAANEALKHLHDEESRRRANAMRRAKVAEEVTEDSNVIRLVRPPSREGDETATCRFADVGGLDAVKEHIRMKIVLPFQRPDLFHQFGKQIGGGVLLYGPPGCGKTLLARATAGECDATFFNVSIDDILDMYFGESERKLAAVFDEARAAAPSVMFLDEIEAIGANRQQLRFSPGKSIVNQLLAEMDGARGRNARMLVVGATNAPWSVDSALRRPGRFDRVIFVPPPDLAARVEILRIHLRNRPVGDDLDLRAIAERTGDFSGADLYDVVERAAEVPLTEALRGGEVRPIRQSDLLSAVRDSRSSAAEWFAVAKNYATFANTGGLYDDLLAYMKARR